MPKEGEKERWKVRLLDFTRNLLVFLSKTELISSTYTLGVFVEIGSFQLNKNVILRWLKIYSTISNGKL